jgi:hypothetical protein
MGFINYEIKTNHYFPNDPNKEYEVLILKQNELKQLST